LPKSVNSAPLIKEYTGKRYSSEPSSSTSPGCSV
jgi:hypothetical protein